MAIDLDTWVPEPYPTIDLEEGNILLIDKPLGWTSFDVVKKVRNALGIKKVGHAGTLDPLATGLLVVCTGKQTKKIDQLMAQEKVYTGTLKLGYTTASYDAESEEITAGDIAQLAVKDVLAATQQFIGPIQQVPPVFSAITVNGKRLYELAREGTDYIPEPRAVTIHEFRITGIQGAYVHFYVRCSKGTYIRSLAHDFGQVLGVGAYLTALRRVASGGLSTAKAANVETLAAHIRRATGRIDYSAKPEGNRKNIVSIAV